MLLILTFTSLLACSHGFENFSNYPKGLTPPVPLKSSPSSIGARIVGGRNATIEEFPYVASLQHEWEPHIFDALHFCTATIISEYWMITTGMCALAFDLENVTVRVGSDYYHEGGIVYGIESFTIHPQFDYIDMDYDIAVFKLNSSLQFSNTVQPIKMVGTNRNVLENTIFTMSSWGSPSFFDDPAIQLKTIDMPTITNELCATVWGDRITERMFCAYEEYVGMCDGDTGAPAVVDDTVIGFASWTYACSAWGFPTVYTDLSSHSEWVTSITGVSSAASVQTVPLFSLILGVIVRLKILF